MTTLSTKYNSKEVEQGKYEKWIEMGVFKPNANPDAKPYSIVIPPPNVTGKLHLGHAWDVTLQDAIIRQKRMQGYDTLWLPGMDHAGIATQAKVEEKLRGEGISRYDLGREKFLEKTWEWKEEYAQTIRSQWAKMGISVDYSRERFTLDEGLSQAVRKVFVSLYEKGIIYRGEYIINWDPAAKTALSDIEVIHKDIQGYEHYFKYMFDDNSGNYLTIMTTRPETMFGDGAIAVHPEDERYTHLIGQHVIVPLTGYRIPVIADEYVDMEKGSGCVKITPAHDPNDFEVGLRHQIKQDIIMNLDGTMASTYRVPEKYHNLDRYEARKLFIQDAKEAGLLEDMVPIVHSVGHSERTGVVVEPRLSTQWFVKMESLAKQAIEAQATQERVEFYPPRFEQTYLTWMENVHDWVISRQLWWGHQIPAWYHKETNDMYVGMEEPSDSENWVQDEDVLDTWFSSALWPFSTMGWPDKDSADFNRYFPTSTLVTGYDIIPFWVSRMIFQSLEFTGQKPFSNALIHGLIRDKNGLKMSKSLGNGIDPMDVIEQYGVDALRWFLLNGSAPGQDVRYIDEKVEASWNFINKIWNASRYVFMNVGDIDMGNIDLSGQKTLADRWILTRLNQTIEQVSQLFEKFEFGEAGRQLYNFIWDDFCDWYIEMSKEILNGQDNSAKQTTRSILLYVLDNILRLLHPIMPFVTEEIWQNMYPNQSIVVAEYPSVDGTLSDETALESMDKLIEIIRSVRNIRHEVNTPLSKQVPMFIKTGTQQLADLLLANQDYIVRFCNPSELTISTSVLPRGEVMSSVISGAEIILPLAGLINVADEIKRLEKEKEKLEKEVLRVDAKLANQGFVAKAPQQVIEAERQKGEDYKIQLETVEQRILDLKAMNA
ncbi:MULTISPECIES: valine--tRNA ligase [unclassified Granulicatella]|uniref:valine--tRNA ligase n=1 Tax=unclassified Granulicatella TaxID=2630493 RepID=UPI0010746506|nr:MULTISPECIES: valine--tRNA ligase [unclassified Granulicatella]MBF0779925.1 valine--tRNA ligase [Granulicatella sp. 19428wC4_WM01]TFU96036.1 valine--tRNA ligase [Granulicatella sp. WM01]